MGGRLGGYLLRGGPPVPSTEPGGFASSTGGYLTRTRYRDWDGHARLVQASGATAKAAEGALKAKLADRDLFQPADTTLTPTRVLRTSVRP